MFVFRPQPQTLARCDPPGPTGALVSRCPADLLDQQGVDAASWIEPRAPGQSAVDHDLNAFNGERCFGHIGGDDRFSFSIRRQGRIMFGWCELAVERQGYELVAAARCPNWRHCSCDLV